LFDIENIQQLAQDTDSEILAKVVFSFSPDIILSPLALPRELLDRTVDSLTTNMPAGALRDVLLQLKTRPVFAEQWPDQYQQGLAQGKARVLQLEEIRGDTYTLADILSADKEIYDWYQTIA
jgi:hypothetical protein